MTASTGPRLTPATHASCRRIIALACGILWLAGSIWDEASAAPPRLNTVYPVAVQRGVRTPLLMVGKEFVGDAQLVLPFAADVRLEGGGAETARVGVTVGRDVVPGIYPVRVRTREGISNLRLIAVTDDPITLAREPNGGYVQGKLALDQAQRVEWPCLVCGDRLERDIDLFRFRATAGQRLVFVTQTWRLGLTPDPLLRLRDAKGRSLVYVHDTPGLGRDERLDFRCSESGEYILEVRSTGGAGWNNHYVLRMGDSDFAQTIFPLGGRRGEKVEFQLVNRDGKVSTMAARVPDDPSADHWHLPLPQFPGTLSWRLASGEFPEVVEDADRKDPQPITWPCTVNGRIHQRGAEDLYRIAVRPGQHVRVRVEAYYLGSCLDGHLLVYDAKNKKLLAQNDDQRYRGDPDPALSFEVPSGLSEVVIALRDTQNSGGPGHAYRLTVEQGGPDFFLWLGRKQNPTNEEDVGWYRSDASDTLNLSPGKDAKLLVSARRSASQDDPHYAGPVQGYDGPIQLRAENVPAGVTVQSVVVPAGKTEEELIVRASDQAPRQPFEIVIVGEGTRADGTKIRHIAERRLHISDPQVPNLPWNWRVTKVTCVTTQGSEAKK